MFVDRSLERWYLFVVPCSPSDSRLRHPLRMSIIEYYYAYKYKGIVWEALPGWAGLSSYIYGNPQETWRESGTVFSLILQ
jgi:hypothetical protein